jgi:hypothetical protein
MYPISFILESLRNDIRRFEITAKASTQYSLELTRTVDRIATAEAKIAKYIKASLVVLGLGLFSVATWRGLHSSGGLTSTQSTARTLSCQYMTISLVRGELVPGPQAADPEASVLCTTTMLQTSQLCREQCNFLANLKGPEWLRD